MNNRKTRLLVPEGRSESDVRRAAMAAHWNWRSSTPKDGNSPRRIEWETCNNHCRIIFVEDHLMDMAYLLLTGADFAEPIQYAVRIAGCLEFETVLEQAMSAKDTDLMFACRCMALVAPHAFDQRVFNIISRALQHKDPTVRWTAVLAYCYLPWPKFLAIIRNVVSSETDTRVKEAMDIALGRRSGFVNPCAL